MNRLSSLFTSLLLTSLCVILTTATVAQPTYDSIVYSRGTFFGNATNDSYLLHAAVDAQGNVYGTGLCRSIPTTPGAYRTTNQGNFDIMVFKLDPTMKTLIWATYIGGANNEGGGGIAVSASGEVYVAGYTQSANFPVTVGSDAAYLANGAVNYFALKLSADGSTLLYSRILGRGAPITQQTQTASKGAHIAINPAGEAFVFSYTNSPNYQITGNAFQATLSGSTDLVISKLSATGAVVYSSFLGGTAAELSYDIAYSNGKIYCSGTTSSAAMPLRTGKVPDAGGDCLVLVADDGAVLNLRKCFVYGSTGADIGYAVGYDSHASRICMTGVSGSVLANSTVLQAGQVTGGFVAGVDTSLTALSFVTMIGNTVVPTSVAARTSNSTVYVAGYATGTVPVSPNAFQSSRQGALDGMMISVDSVGSALKYGTYMGGSNNDYSAAKVLLVDKGCALKVIFGITTHSTDFPTTPNTFQPLKLNGTDDQPALAMFSTIPTAGLTVTGLPCSKEYTFTIYVPCPYTRLVWNFGDSSAPVINVNPVTHIFPAFGTYKVTATALIVDGDTLIKREDVNIGPSQKVDAGPDQTVCIKNTRTQLNASGANVYRWFPGTSVSDSTIANPHVTPTKTTMYYVRGKDAFGCESIDSVLIIVRDIKARVEHDTTICEGRFAVLKASGGAYYAWIPTSGLSSANAATVLASPQTTTTYSLIAFDGTCFDTAKVTVTVIPRPRLKIDSLPSLCANTPVELRVSVTNLDSVQLNGSMYQWSPLANISDPTIPNPIVTVSKDTWYKVTITTNLGCAGTDSVRIVMQKKLKMTITADTGICVGSTVRLGVSGATSYVWSPALGLSDINSANPICSPTTTTTYTVIGRAGSCIDTQRVTVRVNPYPVVKGMARGDTSVCLSELAHLWVENPDTLNFSYSWSPPQDFVNPKGWSVYLRAKRTNNYIVLVSSNYGCSGVDTARVHVDTAISVQATASPSVCRGDFAVIQLASASDSTTVFSWFPNDGVFNPYTREYRVQVNTDSAIYRVHAQKGACFGDATATVHSKPYPVFTITRDTAVCLGTRIRLTALSNQPGIRYRWLNNAGIPDTSLDNALSATPRTNPLYKAVHLTAEADLNGCISTRDVKISILPLPVIVSPPDTLICSGESAVMRMSSLGLRDVVWEPSYGLSATTGEQVIASPMQSTTYRITVTNTDGCSGIASFTVGVKPRVNIHLSIVPINDGDIFYPNDSAKIVIRARSDAAITTPLSFDVVLNANIYEQSILPFTESNGKKYLHVDFPSIDLQDGEVEITKIKGKALQAAPIYSDVIIENITVDSAICPNLGSTPSMMSIGSCFTAGRNVTLGIPLSVNSTPNPVEENATLHISTTERSTVWITLVDALGREIQHLEYDQTSNSHDLPITLTGCNAGVYTVLVQTKEQLASARIVKKD